MSRRLSTSESSSGSENDDFSDWDESLQPAIPTKSLFDATTHSTAEQALEHDRKVWGWDLLEQVERLRLDDYGRFRLINFVRRKVSAVPVRSSWDGS
jgi:protein arginine N-methyltransferase 3